MVSTWSEYLLSGRPVFDFLQRHTYWTKLRPHNLLSDRHDSFFKDSENVVSCKPLNSLSFIVLEQLDPYIHVPSWSMGWVHKPSYKCTPSQNSKQSSKARRRCFAYSEYKTTVHYLYDVTLFLYSLMFWLKILGFASWRLCASRKATTCEDEMTLPQRYVSQIATWYCKEVMSTSSTEWER